MKSFSLILFGLFLTADDVDVFTGTIGTGVYFAHLQQPGGQMMTTLNLVK